MTYLKTSYLPALSLASALLLSACGGGGSSGGTTSPPPPPPPPAADTTAPAVSFSPATLSVESAMTATSTLTATDNVGVTVGPDVDCTTGGNFDVATNVFTADADLTENTESVCTATASDAAGNVGTATLTVTITPDTTAPVLTFTPATLIVQSGATGTATLTVTENATATVSCTNGGSFDVATNVFTAATVTETTESVCTATASDVVGNEGTATLTVTMTPAPVSGSVTLSGNLTYDRVPLNTNTNGLNFNAIVQMPIRQAPVDLLDASGAVIESTVSDDSGAYSFTVDSGTEVRVRVRSEVQQSAPNLIDMQVLDNTSGNSIYAIQGALAEVPNGGQTRDCLLYTSPSPRD